MLNKEHIQRLPTLPGVYLMKDSSGQVLYVGKADNLRSRVGSYLRPTGDNRPQIPRLRARVDSVDFLVTDTGKEALILENNLIKKHRPRYNVYFRDDKTYLSIRIDLRVPFPRPVLVRRVKADGALYFGPYVAGYSLKQTLRFLQKIFPYRICSDNVFRCRSRPCLYHQIGRCPAPCRGKISPEEYREIIDNLILFLQGRAGELLRDLRRRLKAEAGELRYEAAARTRDRIQAIEQTLEKQKINRVDPRDRDVIALESSPDGSVFQVLSIRRGRMQDGRNFFFDSLFPDPVSALEIFLLQFYEGANLPPDEIILPFTPASAEVLQEILRERKNGPVALTVPRRGMKRGWLELAKKNAQVALAQRIAVPGPREILETLREKLGLRRRPEVIEVFDISNFGGREAVGAKAVFRGGEKSPADYRRYRIRLKETPDDYAMLAEVLGRRLKRAAADGSWPDLIVVDGGKGQLNAALRVREELGAGYPDVVALAEEKRLSSSRTVRDRVFIPGRKNPVNLRPGSPALLLLCRARDEAHRFAVTYHRKLRREKSLSSPLDRVAGIGPVLRQRLLERFESVAGIRAATVKELAEVKGISRRLGEKIIADLKPAGGE